MRIDYSDISNWLARPEPTKKADTFFLYPSSYISSKENFKPFADIRDENMIRIANICLDGQGGAFEEETNVFAPLYRQVDPEHGVNLVKEGKENTLDDVLMADVVDSFEYYMKNINQGRPFILAGHSQGSTVLLRLLSKYFSRHKNILSQMVAAYAVGYSVTEEYLNKNPHLKFAEGESDIGVIVSWNTEMPNFEGENPVIVGRPKVINPLNWKVDDTYAPVSLNQGSLIKGKFIKPGIADGKINLKRGVLECGSVNPEDFKQSLDFFSTGCYHAMDYGFYFANIKENVKKRIDVFFEKSKGEKNEFK